MSRSKRNEERSGGIFESCLGNRQSVRSQCLRTLLHQEIAHFWQEVRRVLRTSRADLSGRIAPLLRLNVARPIGSSIDRAPSWHAPRSRRLSNAARMRHPEVPALGRETHGTHDAGVVYTSLTSSALSFPPSPPLCLPPSLFPPIFLSLARPLRASRVRVRP